MLMMDRWHWFLKLMHCWCARLWWNAEAKWTCSAGTKGLNRLVIVGRDGFWLIMVYIMVYIGLFGRCSNLTCSDFISFTFEFILSNLFYLLSSKIFVRYQYLSSNSSTVYLSQREREGYAWSPKWNLEFDLRTYTAGREGHAVFVLLIWVQHAEGYCQLLFAVRYDGKGQLAAHRLFTVVRQDVLIQRQKPLET